MSYMSRMTTDVLRQPPESFAVTLTHDDRAHEDFDGTNVPERDLAFAGSLVQTQLVPQLFFGNGSSGVNLVTKDEEGDLGERLNGHCGLAHTR